MMPEGILERWRVADGATLAEGDVVAEVRIEDALHELIAPGKGRLTQLAGVNDVIEPGSLIGRIG
jgi:pyruvate/2-oxoglutarate dehydrogenase complex dihydrolipoamide acyltransferase (E2) component